MGYCHDGRVQINLVVAAGGSGLLAFAASRSFLFATPPQTEPMSHTYQADGGTTFNYNPDMSGDVHIVRWHDKNAEMQTLEIPGDDLLEFAAHVIRNRRISALESATVEELLQ